MLSFLVISALLMPIPLYVLYRKIFEKKQENSKALELRKTFLQLSRRHRLSMDDIDVFAKRIIGLDRKNNKLLLIEYTGKVLQKNCIALGDLESHRLIMNADKIGDRIHEVILELKFGNQKPINFTFYDSSRDDIYAFSFLRDKAKFWDAKIHFHSEAYKSNHALDCVL